jgi:hypothetical protein
MITQVEVPRRTRIRDGPLAVPAQNANSVSSHRRYKQKTRHLPGFSLLTLEASIS